MPFADIKQKTSSNFKKTEFLSLSEGSYVIRVLDPKATTLDSHWVNKRYIACLGSDTCPICQNNFRILKETPSGYREVPGWTPIITKYYFNVLDRSMVKTCPKCQAENRKYGNAYPTNCTSCNELIVTAEEHPSNKVKILSLPKRDATALNNLEKSVLDSKGNPVGLTNLELTVVVTGSGTSKNVTFIHEKDIKLIEVPADALYDMNSALIRLTADEIINFLKGVSLKDIFAARKTDATEKAEEKLTELSTTIASEIEGLF